MNNKLKIGKLYTAPTNLSFSYKHIKPWEIRTYFFFITDTIILYLGENKNSSEFLLDNKIIICDSKDRFDYIKEYKYD